MFQNSRLWLQSNATHAKLRFLIKPCINLLVPSHENRWDYLASPFWRRLFGAGDVALGCFGAELFWRWAVLALVPICLITLTHTSLPLELCFFSVLRGCFSRTQLFFSKKATNSVHLHCLEQWRSQAKINFWGAWPLRKSKHAEAAHRKMYAELGSDHPVIWKFIDGIRKIQRERYASYEQLISGKAPNKNSLNSLRLLNAF